MGVRGIDISEHQASLDVEKVARDNGVGFAFVRTNYGAHHDDRWFHSHCDAAERAGALIVPYVYVLASDIRGSIDDAQRIAGGRYESMIVDWEHGSGGGAELRRAHELLWERGFTTPVVYDPKWYWESVGSPDVSWLRGRVRGHWKSWYADNQARSFDDALARVPAYVWDDNRGGIPTVIVQFTGTGRLNGYGGNLDLNYFPGSRAELAELLGSEDVNLNEQRVPVSGAPEDDYTEMADIALGAAVGNARSANVKLDELLNRPGVELTEAQLDALADRVAGRLGGTFAGQVADLLAARLRD